MFKEKRKSKEEIAAKREDALANSCYSIVKQKKITKSALEKSNVGLVVKGKY
nr:MAG TPA: hypothetical protein [Bacteriophage sp.]